jgi:nucleoside-diphosphate-sugar epimerase
MGGAGFVFTGDNDADIMHNSAAINLNMLHALHTYNGDNDWLDRTKIFYSSSACMYPEYAQTEADNPGLKEQDAYPAAPDSEYGWEKLFSERMYLAYNRNYGIPVRVARFHNIFGPLGTWKGGREKAPAALCRKVAELPSSGGEVEIWGDGEQTRSFLYVTECVSGIRRLVDGDWTGPVNIGSDELVSINHMVDVISEIAGKKTTKLHISGPIGIRGRNSDNSLIKEKFGWGPNFSLRKGLELTYPWIEEQIQLSRHVNQA